MNAGVIKSKFNKADLDKAIKEYKEAALPAVAQHKGARSAFLLVNPLHAPLPGLPQEPSPYYPSSRRFLNPLYLRLEDVPGAEREALNAEPNIERDRVYELKLGVLEAGWLRARGRAAAFGAAAGFAAAVSEAARAGMSSSCQNDPTQNSSSITRPKKTQP